MDKMDLIHNISSIHSEIPEGVKLVCVTKKQRIDDIMEIYLYGHKIFGENKCQDLTDKQKQMPQDVEWHFIGHLQTNKVKYIVPFVSLIHSVDSLGLICEINRQACKYNRVVDCLLQFHIAAEQTKYGMSYEEARVILDAPNFPDLKFVRITGVMGMATFTQDKIQIRQEFSSLRKYFTLLKHRYFSQEDSFQELSMGMSDDYRIAIEEGSTIIRIGTKIFG